MTSEQKTARDAAWFRQPINKMGDVKYDELRSRFENGFDAGLAHAEAERDERVKVTQSEIDAVPDDCSTDWEPMARAICYKIEAIGASEDLTELSVMANNLRRSIGEFNKYCDDHFEKMCKERPDLEPMLRGKSAYRGEQGE